MSFTDLIGDGPTLRTGVLTLLRFVRLRGQNI